MECGNGIAEIEGEIFFFSPSYFGNAIAKITFLFRTNFDLSFATLWESHIADSFKLDSEAREVERFTVTRSPNGSDCWEVCDCERAMMGPWAMVAHGGTQIAEVARLIVGVVDGCQTEI